MTSLGRIRGRLVALAEIVSLTLPLCFSLSPAPPRISPAMADVIVPPMCQQFVVYLYRHIR